MNRLVPCALLLAASIAHAEISTKLTIEPSTVQAGLPASLVVTITNGGATDVKLPHFITMRAEKADGSSFIVTEGTTKVTRPIPNSPVTLAPQASTIVRFDPDGGWTMPWFGDAHLTEPGTYKISARLTDEVDGSKAGSASPSATLTVTPAKGEDAVVCEAARTKAGHVPADSCPVRVLLGDLSDAPFWSKHKSSTYATFYAGSIPGTTLEQIAAAEAHIKANPTDRLIDMRRIYLARLEHLAAGEASAQKQMSSAKAHAAKALALYREVATSGRIPDARRRAALLAADLDTQMTQMHWR